MCAHKHTIKQTDPRKKANKPKKTTNNTNTKDGINRLTQFGVTLFGELLCNAFHQNVWWQLAKHQSVPTVSMYETIGNCRH